ncbi:hypothetical protein [uncultured Kordia sp.]|uniref:glycine-rich domain-containing protein n=1 Tax=uncultured Kordia sp. TaxID=507699 RepID=UPI002616CD59|nr:hypothetical protein [uncultured Kordia sp.]
MTSEQKTLWNKIEAFQLDDSQSTFTFTDRLCRENGWKYEYGVRAIHEYKKFMFLICIADHPLTPSDQVDQVWHLHLLYTRSYWTEFCQHILEREIHHGPTKGGANEKEKFNDWYEKTKELYVTIFKKNVPTDIWPSSKIRFGEKNFRRVNLHRNWVFPKFKKI